MRDLDARNLNTESGEIEGDESLKRNDVLAKGMPSFVPRAQLKDLSKKISWRNPAQLAWEWTTIIAVVVLSEQLWTPLAYLFALMIIGSRQVALGLMMHEASHSILFHKRKWNEFFGELFISWPILMSLEEYREEHMPHHRHLNTDKDPTWDAESAKQFPLSRLQMAKIFCLCLSGMAMKYLLMKIPTYFWRKRKELSQRDTFRLAFYLTHIVVFAIWPITMKYYALYWLIPGATWGTWVNYVRVIAEHEGLPCTHDLNQSRTVQTNFLTRIFYWPHNFNYHIAHHLYPSVPWYNLPKLEKLLMANPNYGEKAHRTNGLFGLLKECTKKADANGSEAAPPTAA